MPRKDLAARAAYSLEYRKRNAAQRYDRSEAFYAWMDFVKSSPCKDCGGKFPPEAMDFDHVRGEKLEGLGRMTGSHKTRIFEEMQKCELVCANCHRVRTKSRREKHYAG